MVVVYPVVSQWSTRQESSIACDGLGEDNNARSLGNGVVITRSYNGGSDATTQCEVLDELETYEIRGIARS